MTDSVHQPAVPPHKAPGLPARPARWRRGPNPARRGGGDLLDRCAGSPQNKSAGLKSGPASNAMTSAADLDSITSYLPALIVRRLLANSAPIPLPTYEDYP